MPDICRRNADMTERLRQPLRVQTPDFEVVAAPNGFYHPNFRDDDLNDFTEEAPFIGLLARADIALVSLLFALIATIVYFGRGGELIYLQYKSYPFADMVGTNKCRWEHGMIDKAKCSTADLVAATALAKDARKTSLRRHKK